MQRAVDFADECGTLNSSPMCSVRSATTSGLGTDLRWLRLQLAQRARTGTRIDPFRSCGCRLNRPSRPIHNKKSQKGLAMSEKWGISRVGKLELEVGETLQEAIIRLQILPLPPLAWTDCFLQTVREHEVTIIGTETHPDKIEAVARPAEVEDVLGKIDSAIENANLDFSRGLAGAGGLAVGGLMCRLCHVGMTVRPVSLGGGLSRAGGLSAGRVRGKAG